MKNIVVAIFGEDDDASEILFKGFKKFSPHKVHLLVKRKYEKKAKSISKDLEKFDIEFSYELCSNFLHLEEVFTYIRKISQLYKEDSVVINVDTDNMSSCLALSSAFVNGIPAIGILDENLIAYPIMKFSYYNAINDKKMELLSIISKHKEIESMDKLSKLSQMSLPLIAYHLKGNRDSKGLVEMKLVETQKEEGSLKIKLTDLGNLIVNGAIDIGVERC